jgi:cysteinyl-tRNA synthetase
MAGSVGNVVNIADLLKRHSAETVRFLLLSTHYRSPIEYSEERLEEIAKSLQSFYRFFERYEQMMSESFYSLSELPSDQFGGLDRHSPNSDTSAKNSDSGVTTDDLVNEFMWSMADDLNSGAAIGAMFKMLNKCNNYADLCDQSGHSEAFKSILRYFARQLRTMGSILGLFWEPPAKATLGGGDQLVSGLMQLLLDLRDNLRTTAKSATKDNPLKKPLFDQTDLIRSRLKELGVTLEDRPGGTTWRVG